MSPAGRRSFKPRKKTLKLLIARLSLFSLGRAFQAAAALDQDIRRELAAWPDGYTVIMKIGPRGPAMVLVKEGGRMKYRGEKERPADLLLNFKHLEAAFPVLTAQIGTPQAFAQNRATLKGDLGEALRLIRCLDVVQGYLFPYLIKQRIMKRVPPLTPKKMLNRGVIYMLGLPLGRP